MPMFDILFALVWIVVGFLVLRYAAQRFFAQRDLAGKYQSDVVAGGIVAAFIIGAVLPFHNQPAAQTASNQTASAPATTATAAPTFTCHSPSPRAMTMKGVKKAQGGQYQGHVDSLRPESESDRSSDQFQAGCNIYANGWTVDMNTKSPPPGIAFIIDSKKIINATSAFGVARPDVASALNAPGTLHCGFLDAEIPTEGLRKGTHTIQLVALSKDGKRYYSAGDATTITLR
jgi:hypothetical protein